MQAESEIRTTPRPRVIRTYSPQERSEAVAAYNETGNLEKVSATLGIPLSTLQGWTSNPAYFSQENRKDLADKFEFAANVYLDLAVKKSKKASFAHLMTGVGIAIDKMQLLRGQPTSINSDPVSAGDICLLLRELSVNPEFRERVKESIQAKLQVDDSIDVTPVEEKRTQ